MRLVCYLPETKMGRLRAAADPHWMLVPAESWSSYVQLSQAADADLAIVDPFASLGDGHGSTVETRDLLQADLRLGFLVLYLQPAMLSTCLPLVWHRRARPVLWDVDDAPTPFRDIIQSSIGSRRADQTIAHLLRAFSPLPRETVEALRLTFSDPLAIRSVEDLAAFAGISSRTLEKQLRHIGMIPSRLMRVARVLCAHTQLSECGRSVQAVARLWGDSTGRRLRHDIRTTIGLLPGDLRRVPVQRLLTHLVEALSSQRGA